MAISIRTENPNIYLNASGQTKTVTSEQNNILPLSGNNTPNSNTCSTENNTDNVTTTVKRSAKQLYDKLNNIGVIYNIKQNELKEIFESVSGKSEAELLNSEESEINGILNIINKSIEVLKSRKANIDKNSIINVSKGLRIMTDNQWDLDKATKRLGSTKLSQESFADRIKRYYSALKNVDFENPSPEDLKLIEKYTKLYMEKQYKSNRVGQRDIAVLLANSKTDAERDLFENILTNIKSEFRAKFVSSWLYSYESKENKAKAADYVMNNVVEITDGTGVDDTQQITFTARRNQTNTEEIVKTDKRFYSIVNKYFEENNIKSILNKLKENENNVESLNDNEKNIYKKWQQYQAIMSGGISGTVANQNIDEEFKTSHIKNFVNPQIYNYGEDIYRQVMSDVHKFYEEHSDEINMDAESFAKFMDEVTEGNYSTIASGSEESLNSPNVTGNVSETAPNNNEKAPQPDNSEVPYSTPEVVLHEITERNDQKIDLPTKKPTTSKQFFSENKGDRKTVLSYLREGFSNTVDGINSGINSVVEWAIKIVSRSNIKNLYFNAANSNENQTAIAKTMDLYELSKINGNTTYMTKKIEELTVEKEKQIYRNRPDLGIAYNIV